MTDSQYGSVILLLGGIHTFLVFAMGIAAIIYDPPGSTVFGTIIQSTLFWLILAWSGILLVHLGLTFRRGHVESTDDGIVHNVVIYSAATHKGVVYGAAWGTTGSDGGSASRPASIGLP